MSDPGPRTTTDHPVDRDIEDIDRDADLRPRVSRTTRLLILGSVALLLLLVLRTCA